MELARHIRTLLVFGTAASLMTLGAFLGNDAVAQAPPECPRDWPSQKYEGPLRSEDYGRNQHENFHTDADGKRWFVIRASDSNGYTTITVTPPFAPTRLPMTRDTRQILPTGCVI